MEKTALKYQVLARRYRPQKFSDVASHEAVITTLKNAIRFDKVAHAYLFSGSRGVGKTTLARLFAKALNCQEKSGDFEPCNQCPSCVEIASGQSLDVIEIDGASNRGIDDIRQINETVAYAPSHGRYKIYIIDEVHMLTKEAFNALLKTLEEPPPNAKFFFATTEPHKVLPTIVSRCQRFDLRRLKVGEIVQKLEKIGRDLNREIEPSALYLIASFAEGSLRDAESLFDQILCLEEGKVKEETIRNTLGLISQEEFFSLDTAFFASKVSFAFELAEKLYQSGKDFSHFLSCLIEHYRTLALLKTLGEKALDLPTNLLSKYLASSQFYTEPQCLYILEYLLKQEAVFSKSAFPRVAIETILLHIIRSKNKIPVEVLVKRLSELEEALKGFSDEAPLEELPFEKPSEKAPMPEPKSAENPKEPAVENGREKAAMPEPAVVENPKELPSSPQEPSCSPPLILEPAPFNPYAAKEVAQALDKIISPPEKGCAPKAQGPLQDSPVLNAIEKDTPASLKKDEGAKTLQEAIKPEAAGKGTSSYHPSHYDTLMRFAQIELEGTFKKL